MRPNRDIASAAGDAPQSASPTASPRARFECSGPGIVTADLDGRLTGANPAFCRMLGYQEEDLLGRDIHDLVHPADRDGCHAELATMATVAIVTSQCEIRRLRKDGREVRCLESVSLVRDAEGQPAGTFTVVREIEAGGEEAHAPARWQSGGDRMRSLHLLTAVAETSEDCIYAKDPEGRYILCNRAACETIGKPAGWLLGRNDRELFPPELAERFMATDREAMIEQRQLCFEEDFQGKDGPAVFLSTKGPLRNARGRVVGLFSIARDITVIREAQQALTKSEERLRLSLQAVSDGLWDWDVPRGHAYLSSRCYEMAGYAPQEVVPSFDFFQRVVHPDDRPQTMATAEAHLRGETPATDVEYRLITAAGEIRWVRGRGQVVARDESGAPLRMIGTITDITRRKEAEQALCTMLEENTRLGRYLLALQEDERAELARELHDELSEPLTAIRAYAMATRRASAANPENPRADAAAIEDAARQVYAISHRLMEGLHPQILDSAGLAEALQTLISCW